MTLTPSENYARAKTISKFPKTRKFSESFPFELDDFQIQACHALEQGKGVLVAAPTGAGKTIVGEFAVDLVINSSGKCFYTTPIKALSNQKYSELCQKYGEDRIGLLTGDVSNNSEAQIVVMTTEVLRNMIYSNSPTVNGFKPYAVKLRLLLVKLDLFLCTNMFCLVIVCSIYLEKTLG